MATANIPPDLRAKIDQFKALQSETNPQPMTTAEVIDYAVESTTKAFSSQLDALQKRLSNENRANRRNKAALLELTQQVDILTKTLQGPALPKGFKPSQELLKKQDQLQDLQAEVTKLTKAETHHYQQALLEDISRRNSKAVAAGEYRKALDGPYSAAVLAIKQMRDRVQQEGLTFVYGAGVDVKGLYDPTDLTFFTFDAVPDRYLEYGGARFQVKRAELSPIGAGNLYHLQLIH